MDDYDVFLDELRDELEINLERAAIYYKGKVKEAINRGQERERVRGATSIRYRGLDPSLPEEPPKKITGHLQRSIAHEMVDGEAYVGTNLAYGYFLELGTIKMAARPYLRSTLATEADKIAEIMMGA